MSYSLLLFSTTLQQGEMFLHFSISLCGSAAVHKMCKCASEYFKLQYFIVEPLKIQPTENVPPGIAEFVLAS